MKTILVKSPSSRSFTLFGDESNFAADIVKANKITVDIYFMSKTHVSLSIQSGPARFKMNYESKFSTDNNITLVTKAEHSYFTGKTTVSKYFKYTKKQNFEVLKKHIESNIEWLLDFLHIRSLVDYDNFIIEIEVPNSIWDATLNLQP